MHTIHTGVVSLQPHNPSHGVLVSSKVCFTQASRTVVMDEWHRGMAQKLTNIAKR